MLSMPILLALGGTLLFLMRSGGMRITHGLVGILFGAQMAATAVAGEVNTAVTAADHLLRTVFP
jgi:hypothetical protein